MKPVNKDMLKDVAHSLMFDMSEEEYDLLEEEFQTILKQMSLIHEIKGVENVEPMTFPFVVYSSYLRKDVPTETLDKEEALGNAKDVVENQIRIPRVIK